MSIAGERWIYAGIHWQEFILLKWTVISYEPVFEPESDKWVLSPKRNSKKLLRFSGLGSESVASELWDQWFLSVLSLIFARRFSDLWVTFQWDVSDTAGVRHLIGRDASHWHVNDSRLSCLHCYVMGKSLLCHWCLECLGHCLITDWSLVSHRKIVHECQLFWFVFVSGLNLFSM